MRTLTFDGRSQEMLRFVDRFWTLESGAGWRSSIGVRCNCMKKPVVDNVVLLLLNLGDIRVAKERFVDS